MQAAARAIGQQLRVVNASIEAEIDAAFAALVNQRDTALLVTIDPLYAAGDRTGPRPIGTRWQYCAFAVLTLMTNSNLVDWGEAMLRKPTTARHHRSRQTACDREIGRLGSIEDFRGVGAELAKSIEIVGPITQAAAWPLAARPAAVQARNVGSLRGRV
jgi:hypothetical protein